MTNMSTQTLKLHMSCVKGLHHHVPILFDYYHFAVIDTTIHATVTALGLPNHRYNDLSTCMVCPVFACIQYIILCIICFPVLGKYWSSLSFKSLWIKPDS